MIDAQVRRMSVDQLEKEASRRWRPEQLAALDAWTAVNPVRPVRIPPIKLAATMARHAKLKHVGVVCATEHYREYMEVAASAWPLSAERGSGGQGTAILMSDAAVLVMPGGGADLYMSARDGVLRTVPPISQEYRINSLDAYAKMMSSLLALFPGKIDESLLDTDAGETLAHALSADSWVSVIVRGMKLEDAIDLYSGVESTVPTVVPHGDDTFIVYGRDTVFDWSLKDTDSTRQFIKAYNRLPNTQEEARGHVQTVISPITGGEVPVNVWVPFGRWTLNHNPNGVAFADRPETGPPIPPMDTESTLEARSLGVMAQMTVPGRLRLLEIHRNMPELAPFFEAWMSGSNPSEKDMGIIMHCFKKRGEAIACSPHPALPDTLAVTEMESGKTYCVPLSVAPSHMANFVLTYDRFPTEEEIPSIMPKRSARDSNER